MIKDMTTNELNKIEAILLDKFNIFHTDMILRAIQDDDVNVEDFRRGCFSTYIQEYECDKDEFIPKEFKNV